MAGPNYLVSHACAFLIRLSKLGANAWSSYCIVIVLAVVLYLFLRAENKRREGLRLDEEEREKMAFQDLTDKQNLWFRYAL